MIKRCINWHELTNDNIYIHNGKRACKECRKIKARNFYRKLRNLSPSKFRS